MSTTTESLNKVRVWDLPVRVFHWLLVTSFFMAWFSHESSRFLNVHVFAGYSFFGLLLFRLVWGVFGTHYARFKEFAYGWRDVTAYLKGLFGSDLRHYIGHNPAGAWAIFALLVLGLVLAISGIVVLGAEEQQGPLAGLFTFRQSPPWRELHEITAFALLALVFMHVMGVITESILHRENLVGAMFRGTKWIRGESARVPPHRLLGGTLMIAVFAWGLVAFGGYLSDSAEQPYLPFKGPQLTQNDTWNEECGACHLAFHPSLLPARSWNRMLDQQDRHFEEDLMLDDALIDELRAYAVANAAEQEATEAAWRINTTVAPDQSPQEITATGYWKKQHEAIQDATWQHQQVRSKTNCAACHLDAKQGTFEDSAMQLPDKPRGGWLPEWVRSLF